MAVSIAGCTNELGAKLPPAAGSALMNTPADSAGGESRGELRGCGCVEEPAAQPRAAQLRGQSTDR